MKSIVPYCFLVMALTAFNCTKVERIPLAPGFTGNNSATVPARNLFNVTYGSHPRHKLDLYLPAGRNVLSTRLLILLHGGEWSKGDKSQMEFFINNLRHDLKDFAFATINYRYVSGNSNLFPAQEQDILAAIQKLLSLSDSFSISKKHAVLGESAGGHLALLYAYKHGSPDTRAAIAVNAPSNLVDMYDDPINNLNRSLLESVTGKTPGTSTIYHTSSPFHYVSNANPATLLFHSSDDGFVSLRQSEKLSASLNAATVPNTLVVLQGEKHVLSQAAYEEIFKKTISFLNQPLLFR